MIRKNILTKMIGLMLIMLFLVSVVGCNKNEEKKTILTPEGIPLIAIGSLLTDYEVATTAGASLLQSELLQENYDAIIAPVTLGAQLSLKGSLKYQIAGLITFNNMYIISRTTSKLASASDLEGKTIYVYGQNQPSDIALHYALSGINCTYEYADSVATVVSSYFVPGSAEYALVAEPYLSKIKITMGIDINVLDVSSLLASKSTYDLDYFPQAAVYVLATNTRKDNNKLLRDVEKGINKAKNDASDYATTLLAMDKDVYPLFNSLGNDVLTNVIKTSGIDYLKAKNERTTLEAYFKLIDLTNSKLFNGALPEDSFYYQF